MTDKELKNKATEWIRSQGWSEENLPNDEYIQMCDAYVAGAKEMQEETQKKIIEIEKVSDYRWEENQQLKQENEQLKAQIKKLHNCENCKHFKFNGFHQQNECSKYYCEWELKE